MLCSIVRELFEGSPEQAGRCREFSADRRHDQGCLKKDLWEGYGVRPLIDTWLLWQEEKQEPGYDPSQPILRLLDPTRTDNILHSECGEVYCRYPGIGENRPMEFQGLESDRKSLKYRQPPMHIAAKRMGSPPNGVSSPRMNESDCVRFIQ